MIDNKPSNKAKKIALIVLMVIGALGILDTILLIPVTSSVTLGMAFPAVFGLFLIAFSTVNLLKKQPIFKSRILRRILYAATAVAAVFFLTVEAFIWQGAHTKEAEDTKANFVIVLGCGIFPDGTLTLTLKNRLDAALEYMQKFPETICVVSGGQGANEPMTEAQAMSEYLEFKGIDESRIIREGQATSTQENLLYSFSHMDNLYPDREKSVALVSSDFHIFRIKFLAERYSMEAIGIPTDTPWYIRLNCYIREFFAVVKSFLFDR